MKKLYDYDHPYYCSDNNYYSNDAAGSYETFDDFYSEFFDADIDYNLIFRFDVKEDEDNKGCYYAEVFIMHQRKGIFAPIMIESYTDNDEEKAREILSRHWAVLKTMWAPISEDKQ